MSSAPLPLDPNPIRFGTDGWRGVLGVDITVERLLPVAAAAAQELAHSAPDGLNSRTVVIGYDRRFLAPELAEAIAEEGYEAACSRVHCTKSRRYGICMGEGEPME